MVGVALIPVTCGQVVAQTQTPDRNQPTLGQKADAKGEKAPPRNPAPLRVYTPLGGGDRFQVLIVLNHTGVASARFRNARNPPDVLDAGSAKRAMGNRSLLATGVPLRAAADAATDALTAAAAAGDRSTSQALKDAESAFRIAFAPNVDITFQNDAADEKLIVSFTAYPSTNIVGGATNAAQVQANLQKHLPGGHAGTCKNGDDQWTCDASIAIDRRQLQSVPVSLLARVDATKITPTPIKFTVSFFQENATPAQANGYFSVVPSETLVEADNATNWSGSAELAAKSEPDADDEILSDTDHFSGNRAKAVDGKGLLTADTNLGSRATASVDFQYKKGALGDPDTGKVNVPRYQLDVHALRPIVLSFGHFEFAKPSNGVAVAESGEGWRVSYDNFSVSQLFNVDGGPAIDKTDVRHDKEVMLQLQNVGGLRYVLEGVNLTSLYGRVSYDQKGAAATAATTTLATSPATTPTLPHGVEHQYWTYGAEALLTGATGRLRGSASVYHGGRSAVNSNFVRQNGVVLDTSWSWTHFGDVDTDTQTREVQFFFSAELAQAGDFTGEHQAFGPDVRFFSGFLANIAVNAGLGEGLAKKRYVSLGYTDQRFSALQAVAWVLQIPTSEIGSKSSSVTFHDYRSTSDAHRGRLGNELDIKFDIETPAKVTSSLGVTYFRPDGYLKNILVPSDSSRTGWWEVSSSVKIAFKQ